MDNQEFKAKQAKERAVIRNALNTPAGREFLNLMADMHIWQTAYHDDPNVVYFRLGQQELVRQLVEICEAKDE